VNTRTASGHGVSVATLPVAAYSAAIRTVSYALIVIALLYAVLAGLRTVNDFDLGWQLATGRWIVEHHQIPSTDVFSYTAAGKPWIYPVGSSLFFYLVFLAGGYAGLSWLGVAACAGTVALLLRRGGAAAAAIAILVLPRIAARTGPRAEMFTAILFAAFLRVLWENFQSGRARLWLLPLMMAAWVNLHLGFIAGFAMVGAYVAVELSEMIFAGERRRFAWQRLLRAYPWLLATLPATLINPWGWNLYRAIARQEQAMAQHAQWINEWSGVPLNWRAVSTLFTVRDTKGVIFAMMAVATLAVVLAAWRRQPGAALLIAAAAYIGARHVRLQALFGCVLVVVGGWAVSSAWEKVVKMWHDERVRTILTVGAAALFGLLAFARAADLVSNRHYLGGTDTSTFGTGLSWYFPERAAAFVEREDIPGEIFHNYNTGGFLVWRLGPARRDYLDGRAIPFGAEAFEREVYLMSAGPDSPAWKSEVSRYGINSVLLSLARYDGRARALPQFCASKEWALVYMDEVSAVFVRRALENAPLITRSSLDCSTVPLPANHPSNGRDQEFNRWANAAFILNILGRQQEAWTASARAMQLFPDSANLHFVRAQILSALGRPREAEQEYGTALQLEPNDATWADLAGLYRQEGRTGDAEAAMRRAIEISPRPHLMLMNLGFSYLQEHRAEDALRAFDDAEQSSPNEFATNLQIRTDLARGRASAWNMLGDQAKAIRFEEEAVHGAATRPELWFELAQLYEISGRSADAQRAREMGTKMGRGVP